MTDAENGAIRGLLADIARDVREMEKRIKGQGVLGDPLDSIMSHVREIEQTLPQLPATIPAPKPPSPQTL